MIVKLYYVECHLLLVVARLIRKVGRGSFQDRQACLEMVRKQ